MKNWMINTSGEIVLVMRSGDNIRNQSIIRIASISKKEVVRYRSNRVPKWIIADAINVLGVDYDPSDVYKTLGELKVGEFAKCKRKKE